VYRGANKKLEAKLISTLKAHKLLRSGCEGYLYNVVDSAVAKPLVKNIPIVYEFSDVLPRKSQHVPT